MAVAPHFARVQGLGFRVEDKVGAYVVGCGVDLGVSCMPQPPSQLIISTLYDGAT